VVAGFILIGAFLAGGFALVDRWMPSEREPSHDTTDVSPSSRRSRPAGSQLLADGELDQLATVVASAIAGEGSADEEMPHVGSGDELGPVYVMLRQGGLALAEAWADGDTALDAVVKATETALRDLSVERRREEIDAVEVVLTHSFREIDLPDDPSVGVLSSAHRGVSGLEITDLDGKRVLVSPTGMLASNRDFGRTLEAALEELDLPSEEALRQLRARRFGAQQALILLGERPVVHHMERGNTYVPVEAVTHDAVTTLVDSMSDWLVRAVHDDGRMTYKYWPSRGEESTANNMIRQWMATTALGRVAATEGSDELWSLSRRNISYNLDHFYREDEELGLIVEDGVKVKLGAVALAGRALVEHRDRDDYAETEAALARMVDHLWREDGSFETWFLPPDAEGQENFYPGEALYFWSALYADSEDPELLERFMRSFRYYRDWHLDPTNRNPAFVPWHTQAYFEVWQQTGDRELADFIFEMNDWLLGVQQWDDALYRDTKGRFYDPHRPFGPPHASSTGVYLEGLVDAYQLARTLAERDRAEAYRTAIVRGLRSVMQLQFSDEVDMYYISKRDRVLGGVRTEVYDNEIRVDNVQHNLMAAMKVLEVFTEADFRP